MMYEPPEMDDMVTECGLRADAKVAPVLHHAVPREMLQDFRQATAEEKSTVYQRRTKASTMSRLGFLKGGKMELSRTQNAV